MSNNNHILYLYRDEYDLVTTTSSMYVDNRPMNTRTLKAHKGMSNELFFNIRDRDRRKQNVFSETVRAYMVNPSTQSRIFSKILEHTSDVGIVKLILLDGDLANIDPGRYQLYITRSDSETNDLPVYSDQNNNINIDIEITDQTNVQPVPTQMYDTFMQTGNTLNGDAANSFVTSAMYGNTDRNFSNAQHTMALQAPGYTGQVIIQGSCLLNAPDSDDTSSDWFNITTIDIDDPQTTGNIVSTTFSVNCNWVRAVIYPESGSIERVQLRN